MPRPLPTNFYLRPTRQVARDLVGCFVVRLHRGRRYIAQITETEAYCGPRDRASHASRGRTPRTDVMFGPPGRAYIYLVYGMYHCLNAVTERDGYPAAVLIRAGKVFKTLSANTPLTLTHLTPLPATAGRPGNTGSGPGKLCRALQIDRALNTLPLTGPELAIYDFDLKPRRLQARPRVGIDYAGPYRDKLWRYVGQW